MSPKTSDKITLDVQKREITGKRVKQMRKGGLIPANVFGPGFISASISVEGKAFLHTFKQARETGIVYITLDGKTIPTLIRNIQRDPLTQNILHVDFRKIDLKQKIETSVPIQITGESPAVTQLGGVLLTQHDHLTVEALPTDIPQHIEIDISRITELGQDIKVSDLVKSSAYETKEAPETIIVSVIAHKEESVTPETTAAAPEVITGAEEAPVEGETPVTTDQEEKKPEKKEQDNK